VDRLRRDQRTADSDRRAGLARLSAELVKIKGQLATTAGAIKRLHHEIERRRIRAPVAGRIGELTPLRIGAYVDEGQKICTVVPRGDLRAVGLLSPTTAMGRVRPGQKARLRLHGFPWIQYGSVPATVTRVAREPSQGRLRVELSVQPDPGSRIPIQHGLPGVLEIEVERVRPWTLVLRTAGKLISDRPPPPAGGVE
jgi:membrane fusion protein (multidrug efflux system)